MISDYKHFKKYNQLISDPGIGDCHRACMATLLQLPPEVLPNDHCGNWFINWYNYLIYFGLETRHGHSKGSIWYTAPWIATVKSLNYKDVTHSIVMYNGGIVFHDPSTNKRYKTGMSLSGKDCVLGGTSLEIVDITRIHLLDEYRNKIIKNLETPK